MDDKLNYQVDQLDDKVKRLHVELDTLNKQVTEVEKTLLVLKSETHAVESTVKNITNKSGWIQKVVIAGFVSAGIAWIIAGGLAV